MPQTESLPMTTKWTRRTRNALLATACTLALGAGQAMAATLVIGLPADANDGNKFPFGQYGGEYQQVYTASQFPGPMTITALDFYNTQLDSGALALSGSVAIRLSTTTADWNTLSTTFASNIGADNTLVFNGSISQPWAFGNTLHIALATPFTYDPSLGNLLMDVVASTGAEVYFDTNGGNDGNTIMGRVFDGGPGVAINSGYGLITGFESNAVPEPATLALLGAGLVGLGVARRRRAA